MSGDHIGIWGELADVDHQLRHVDVDGVRTRVLQAGSGPDLVLLQDGVYRATPQEQALLSFYANAIAHLVAPKPMAPAVASVAVARP